MAPLDIMWQAPEFEYREKSVSWYWISIIIATLLVGFAIWQKNFLLGVLIVIAEPLLIIWANRTPRLVTFHMTASGIAIPGEKNHLFKDFDSVGVDDLGDEWVELIFTFRAKFKTPFKAFFPKEHLATFREATKFLLREIPYEPTVLDSIEKIIGF